jgi:hypothetical protein
LRISKLSFEPTSGVASYETETESRSSTNPQ